jgi:predicted acetyltransferase
MNTSMNSTALLISATPADLPCIENLMQFYNYDLSQWCEVKFGDDGRYQLQPKAAYWANPTVHRYIVRVADELVGFAVVDQEVRDPSANWNVGYFFVARRFRGTTIAAQMAKELFDRHRGTWEVYHFTANLPAGKFWPRAIAAAATTPVVMSEIIEHDLPTTLYRFSSR